MPDLGGNAPAPVHHQRDYFPTKVPLSDASQNERETNRAEIPGPRPGIAGPDSGSRSPAAPHHYGHRAGAVPRPVRLVSQDFTGTRARVAQESADRFYGRSTDSLSPHGRPPFRALFGWIRLRGQERSAAATGHERSAEC